MSNGLSDKDVVSLLEAVQFALDTERIFQRHWSIHYGKAGVADTEATRFISRLLDQVGKQAKRHGGEMTAIWVRECASPKGEHVHILLHLPAGMSMRNRTCRWIENAGGTYRAGVSKVAIIGGRLADGARSNGLSDGHYRANAMNVMRYLLKACGSGIGNQLALPRVGQGGAIVGKRRGWTQNIGMTARASQRRGS